MSEPTEAQVAAAIERLHTDMTGVQGLDMKPGQVWLNTVDVVNDIVRSFVSEVLRHISLMDSTPASLKEFHDWLESEGGRLGFLFLGYGESPDEEYARGIWNTPPNLGSYIRIATGSSGDNRTAAKEAFVILGAGVFQLFAANHSLPMSEWGWKLDGLCETMTMCLMGLPPEMSYEEAGLSTPTDDPYPAQE